MKPNRNPLRTLIYTCWSVLIICFIIQLLGGDWFSLKITNSTVIEVCAYIETNKVLRQICTGILSITLNTFTALAILGQKFFTKRQIIVYVPTLILATFVNHLPTPVTVLINVWFLIALPLIFNIRKWYRPLIGTVLIFTFQLISLMVKNIGGIVLENTPFLIGLVLQIDSVIMVVLYYLYSIPRKEV